MVAVYKKCRLRNAEYTTLYSVFFGKRTRLTPHSALMKGPYQRVKFDLRRLWECPVCKRRDRTAGSVTFRHCQCQMNRIDGKPVVMKLIEDGAQRLTPPIVIEHQQMPAPMTETDLNLAPPASTEELIERQDEIQ